MPPAPSGGGSGDFPDAGRGERRATGGIRRSSYIGVGCGLHRSDELRFHDRLWLVDLADGIDIVFRFRAGARSQRSLSDSTEATGCPCACRGIPPRLRRTLPPVAATSGRDTSDRRRASGDRRDGGLGMAHAAVCRRDVEVVRHGERSRRSGFWTAHVVERPDRDVGVADHVFVLQHRPRQRFG